MGAAERQIARERRNREIVTLDGDGLSSREIASRVGVTVRTVERVLAKHREQTYRNPPRPQQPPTPPAPPDTPSNEVEKPDPGSPWDTTDLTDGELKRELRGSYLAQFRLLSGQFRQLNDRLSHQLKTGEPTSRIRDVTAAMKMAHDMMLTTAGEARQLGTTKKVRPASPRPIPRRGPEIVPPPGAPRSVDDLTMRTGTDG